jgi:sigma-B regulation protein RsbU (phosphoserine phosphatase)
MIATYTRGNNQNCALVYAEIAPMNGPAESNDGAAWQLRVANAGCVVPLVRRRNGVVDWVDAFGIPLGTRYGAHFGYTPVETTLEKGDMVILTSDGVVEATNWAGEMFGFERLEAAIASGSRTSAQVMSRHLQESVAGFVGDLEPHDDLTIVVVQV